MQTHHRHKRYQLHGARVIFLGVALISLCLVRIDAQALTQTSSQQVLAYATNINRGDLLAETNAARASNGLGPLTLNSQLNTSAQNKGQHMIANNYWAHVAPDGTQPWYFFQQAGYDYQNAGENLAYGFDSSSGTVAAWMNSPSHRANILGSYVDVGFGIANGDNYQGGPNTVVIAHYGTPRNPTPAPAPAPTTPAPTAPAAPAPTPAATPAPTPTAPATPTSEATPASPSSEVKESSETPASTEEKQAAAAPVATTSGKNVNLLQTISTKSTPTYGIVSLVLLVTSAIGFVFTHRALLQHALVTSERYVIKHPMVDIAAVGAISLLALSTTVSHI